MSGVMHSDGLTPPILAALGECPQSARDLAVTLGQSTSRRNVAALRHTLEWMERRGMLQRARTRTGAPWVWEPVQAGDAK